MNACPKCGCQVLVVMNTDDLRKQQAAAGEAPVEILRCGRCRSIWNVKMEPRPACKIAAPILEI
jgi:DNA-directed RNA polymerase subunit RPC12/RpoP